MLEITVVVVYNDTCVTAHMLLSKTRKRCSDKRLKSARHTSTGV